MTNRDRVYSGIVSKISMVGVKKSNSFVIVLLLFF